MDTRLSLFPAHLEPRYEASVEYIYMSFLVTVTCLLPLLPYSVSSAPGSGFNVAGRIESGHIQLGESVLVLPANETASIKGETRF